MKRVTTTLFGVQAEVEVPDNMSEQEVIDRSKIYEKLKEVQLAMAAVQYREAIENIVGMLSDDSCIRRSFAIAMTEKYISLIPVHEDPSMKRLYEILADAMMHWKMYAVQEVQESGGVN